MITRNFSAFEFRCRCGVCEHWDGTTIDIDLVQRLQIIRDKLKETMPIWSGCRCKDHNKAVGGRERSQHLYCRAADIGIGISKPKARILIVSHALALGLSVGLNNSFLHLDSRPSKNQRLFTY